MTTHLRVSGQPCFVLHARPFRESSLIVEMLTRDFGRVTGIKRGARSGKAGVAQSFVRYEASWSGRGDIYNIGGMEALRYFRQVESRQIVSALYINELLLKLTIRGNPSPELFALYEDVISALSSNASIPLWLRRFEANLLRLLGYEPHIGERDSSGELIRLDGTYIYDVEAGQVRPCLALASGHSISGAALIAVQNNELGRSEIAGEIRRFFRMILDYYLQGRGVRSREILQYLN